MTLRNCTACGLALGDPNKDGWFDPCFGDWLPGVAFACCGHGENRAYIQFDNGAIVRAERLYVDGSTNLPCTDCPSDLARHYHWPPKGPQAP